MVFPVFQFFNMFSIIFILLRYGNIFHIFMLLISFIF